MNLLNDTQNTYMYEYTYVFLLLLQPSWMKSKEYWDKMFEDRFERQKMDPERPPLKVILYMYI